MKKQDLLWLLGGAVLGFGLVKSGVTDKLFSNYRLLRTGRRMRRPIKTVTMKGCMTAEPPGLPAQVGNTGVFVCEGGKFNGQEITDM